MDSGSARDFVSVLGPVAPPRVRAAAEQPLQFRVQLPVSSSALLPLAARNRRRTGPAGSDPTRRCAAPAVSSRETYLSNHLETCCQNGVQISLFGIRRQICNDYIILWVWRLRDQPREGVGMAKI